MIRVILLTIILALSTATAQAAVTATIDHKLAYYKDRSPESIALELKANGYNEVHVVCDDITTLDPALAKALSENGVKPWIQVYINGVYSTKNLPEGWEQWRMTLRKEMEKPEFTYLCPNNPDYIKWKKKQIIEALNLNPFYGVDLAGTYFPGKLGPESDDYGCICEHCVSAFKSMYSTDPPNFNNPASENYWKKNEMLYEMWAGFRVSSIINCVDDLVNAKGGIREKCAGVKVATWSLGLDDPDAVNKLREYRASDGAGVVRRVRPDAHTIQTDTIDWSRPELKSSYPQAYKPLAESVRDIAPKTPLTLEVNLGSWDNTRRQRVWIKDVYKSASDSYFENLTGYEYSLGDYIYTEPPTVLQATLQKGVVRLVFNKRLDAVVASNPSNYSLSTGRIDYVKVDGNVVDLSVSETESKVFLTISSLSDDETRRFFHDRPLTYLDRPVHLTLEQAALQQENEH